MPLLSETNHADHISNIRSSESDAINEEEVASPSHGHLDESSSAIETEKSFKSHSEEMVDYQAATRRDPFDAVEIATGKFIYR